MMALTKREEYALAAMSAILRDPATNLDREGGPGEVARYAVRMADLMLAKLRGEENHDDGFTLPKGWFWETDVEVRETDTKARAYLTEQSIAIAWDNDESTYLHLDAAACMLRRAGYPVGERMKP